MSRHFSRAALAAVGALVALAVQPAAAQQASQIWTYWGSGAELAAIQSVIDLNNKAHADTPVEHVVIPGNTVELRRQLQTALLGGTPPAAYQSAMGYEIKTFVDAGQLRPIADVWNKVKGDEIFPTGLQRVMKVDGEPYAIPLNMHVISNIFYNKAIFEKYQITPPTTMAELAAVCEKLEAEKIGCLANGGGYFWSLYNFYAPLVSVVGVDGYFQIARGEMSFTDPKFKQALELYRDTYVKHYLANWSGKTWAQGGDDVFAGRAAMMQIGDWVSGYLKDLGFKPGEDYDYFPAPGVGKAVLIQVDAIATPNGSETSNAAADNFLTTAASPEAQGAFNLHKGSIAANLKTDPSIYDYIGQKTYATMQAAESDNAVLPNLFFLLPTELGSEFGAQIERFAIDPSDETLASVVEKLESVRVELVDQGAFVTW